MFILLLVTTVIFKKFCLKVYLSVKGRGRPKNRLNANKCDMSVGKCVNDVGDPADQCGQLQIAGKEVRKIYLFVMFIVHKNFVILINIINMINKLI